MALRVLIHVEASNWNIPAYVPVSDWELNPASHLAIPFRSSSFTLNSSAYFENSGSSSAGAVTERFGKGVAVGRGIAVGSIVGIAALVGVGCGSSFWAACVGVGVSVGVLIDCSLN